MLSSEIVERLHATGEDGHAVYRDLAAQPLRHLTLHDFAGPATAEIQQECLTADTVVIEAALYNSTIPSQLKAWFDRIRWPA